MKPTKSAAEPGPGAVLDLSGEDITNLDDAAVANLLEEALAEAQVPAKKPEKAEQTPEELDLDEPTPAEQTEEMELDMDESLSADGDEGLDLEALGLTELAGGGAMLSDEDPDLAFPDELYEDQDEAQDPNEAIIEELRAEGEILREEADALRQRVEELTRAERDAMFDRLRLKDENSTLTSQIEVYRDRLLNIQDSLDVHRGRMAKERDKGIQREKERVLRAMLPVVDHMELALHHARNGESGSALVEGFALILEQFHKALAEQGVGRVEAERGLRFDPSLHDAVLREECDEVPPSSITQVLRTGYTLGDGLLRAARVAVSPPPEKEPEEELEPDDEPGAEDEPGEELEPDGEPEAEDEPEEELEPDDEPEAEDEAEDEPEAEDKSNDDEEDDGGDAPLDGDDESPAQDEEDE